MDDRALMYNKDMFRRAGLVDARGEPAPPRTWEQLRDYAKRLTQYDENGNIKVLGFSPTYGNAWLYMYSWMNGGEFMSTDGRTCTLGDTLNVEALTFMRDIARDLGGYDKIKAFESSFMTAALDPFITGKVAMRIDTVYALKGFVPYSRDLNFAVAPPPVSARQIAKGQTATSWSGGWAYAIPYNARHKQAGWEFIRFMQSDEGWRLYCEAEREASESQGYAYIPPMIPIIRVNEQISRKYVLDNPAFPEKFKNPYKVFMSLLPISHFRPVTPAGQVLWHRHDIATQEALYGKKTPSQALDEGAAIVQRELDRLTQPPHGRPIRWSLFFVAYGLLIAGTAGGAYFWDTHMGFRRRLAAVFRRRPETAGGTLEGSGGGYFRAQWKWGVLFTAPWLLGFVVFGAGPMLYSILMSFCDYDVINPARWIGLENYRRMFTSDELVPKSFYNTLLMAIGVPLGMTVSLAMALLLNMRVRGVALWRTLFYLPAIVPFVASIMLWTWLFNPVGGVFNKALALLGLPGPNWLQSETWSKPALIIMGLWGAGGQMLIWLAGLKGISQHYYEAAAIDGASLRQQFRYITLPMLTPYIFFNLVMGLIGVFQIFESAYIMTKGGPVNSTLFYVYHLFNNAFRYGHMGYACAMAWILFLIIMALTVIQLKLSRRWVHYDSE
ncbi:MAG: extracellular solute-binding protein [bacterium]|nr:extracellular solute-binding protein [bacterium]